jgi:hypothetical protein
MNWRRGMFRLLLIVRLPWAAFCAYNWYRESTFDPTVLACRPDDPDACNQPAN